MRSSLEYAFASLCSAVADLRRRSPRTITLMAVCGLIVAVGPLALSLARKQEYQASTSVAQSVERPGHTQDEQVAGVQLVMGEAINSREVQQAVADEVAWLDSRQEVVRRLRLMGRWRAGRPEVVITARGSTLDDAQTLADAASRTLSERAALVSQFGDVYKSTLRSGGTAFDPPTRAGADEQRPVDSILAALPGRLPPSPDPVWAAVAGPAVAAALILAVLALGPLNRQRRPDAGV